MRLRWVSLRKSGVIKEKANAHIDKEIAWLHATTSTGEKITFWGTLDDLHNIDIIKTQSVPFNVKIIGASFDDRAKIKYGTNILVSKNCSVEIVD